MAFHRSEEDLLFPERTLFRLLQDYSTGVLENRANSSFLRAVVEDVDPTGGRLESSPPNPPNSIRARIYTSGMDFNTPSRALTIFYPLGNLRPILVGEHVIVTFEDSAQTSGYWLGILPRSFDNNFSDPGSPSQRTRDSSHIFEGDSPPQREVNPILQYGGLVGGTTTEQDRIIQVLETTTNRWQNKNILLIGDSQMAGAPGIALQNYLRDHGAANITRDGRQGWGVRNWLSGRLHASDVERDGLDDLILNHNPTIVVIMLGGNDGSSGAARRSDYENSVRTLWNMTSNLSDFAIWSGPPTAIGAASSHQSGRDIANDKIRTVVGSRHFIDCRQITNTSQGRTSDGVHFLASSPAIQPWIESIYQAGNLL